MHLLINHLPVFGSILGAIVLIYGLWTKSNQAKIAAYLVLVISSLGGGIAYLTGEAAEETVEDMQGVAKELIGEHEDFAGYALTALIILGIISLISIFVTVRKPLLTRTFALVTLFISLVSFGLVAGTGYLGGQIRHTEINTANAVQENNGGKREEKKKEKDDE